MSEAIELLRYILDNSPDQEPEVPASLNCGVLIKLRNDWKNAAKSLKDQEDALKYPLFETLAKLIFPLESFNGEDRTHAKKLNYLFHNIASARKWITYYLDNHPNVQEHPLHDLCMHIYLADTPFPGLRQFNEKHVQHFFTELKDLELITQYHAYIPTGDKPLNQISLGDMRKCINEALVKNLGIDKLSAEDERVLEQVKKINKRFKKPDFDQAKAVIKLMRKAKNSDHWLPNILMKSEDLELPPGYYMAKLSEKDVRAAMAGCFVGCCQRVGGAGEDSCIHSVVSELGCVYAIFKGKISDGKTIKNSAHDVPIVLSWAWAQYDPAQNACTGICFDSVEFDRMAMNPFLECLNPSQNERIDEYDLINVFYTEFSQRLMKQSHPSIKKISVGTNGATPMTVGRNPLGISNEEKRPLYPWNSITEKYERYRDSESQRILNFRGEATELYYGIHALIKDAKIFPLWQTGNEHIQHQLIMYYSHKLVEMNISFIPLTEWQIDAKVLPPLDGKKYNLALCDPFGVSYLYRIITRFLKGDTSELRKGREQICEFVLKNLTVEALNVGNDERTSLSYAASVETFPIEMIEKMFELGPDLTSRDNIGNTIAHGLFQYRAAESIPLNWAKKYKIDLAVSNDNGLPVFEFLLRNIGKSTDRFSATAVHHLWNFIDQGAFEYFSDIDEHKFTPLVFRMLPDALLKNSGLDQGPPFEVLLNYLSEKMLNAVNINSKIADNSCFKNLIHWTQRFHAFLHDSKEIDPDFYLILQKYFPENTEESFAEYRNHAKTILIQIEKIILVYSKLEMLVKSDSDYDMNGGEIVWRRVFQESDYKELCDLDLVETFIAASKKSYIYQLQFSLTKRLQAVLPNNNLEYILFLIEMGASINSAMTYVIKYGTVEQLELLINRGGNPNFSDNNYTPLIAAAESQNIPCVELLLKKEANFSFVHEKGISALSRAFDNNNTEILRILFRHAQEKNQDFSPYDQELIQKYISKPSNNTANTTLLHTVYYYLSTHPHDAHDVNITARISNEMLADFIIKKANLEKDPAKAMDMLEGACKNGSAVCKFLEARSISQHMYSFFSKAVSPLQRIREKIEEIKQSQDNGLRAGITRRGGSSHVFPGYPPQNTLT